MSRKFQLADSSDRSSGKWPCDELDTDVVFGNEDLAHFEVSGAQAAELVGAAGKGEKLRSAALQGIGDPGMKLGSEQSADPEREQVMVLFDFRQQSQNTGKETVDPRFGENSAELEKGVSAFSALMAVSFAKFAVNPVNDGRKGWF